jgi:hypothetical protein
MYFDGLSLLLPPSRVIAIEAANEDQAGKIAISKMGRSLRVHVAHAVCGATDLPSHSTHARQQRQVASAE